MKYIVFSSAGGSTPLTSLRHLQARAHYFLIRQGLHDFETAAHLWNARKCTRNATGSKSTVAVPLKASSASLERPKTNAL